MASACPSPLQESVYSSNEHQYQHQSTTTNIHSFFSSLEETKTEVEVRAGITDDEVIAEHVLKQRIKEMDASIKLLKKQDAKIKHLIEQTAENNAKDKAITKLQGVMKKQKEETCGRLMCRCETNDKEKTKEQGGRSSPGNKNAAEMRGQAQGKRQKELTDEQKQESQGPQGLSLIHI